jgi:antitoxin ParD1/3/4
MDLQRDFMMQITLNSHYEMLLQNKLATGLYESVNEILQEALRLLEERDQLYELQLKNLHNEIQQGINSGEATPLDIEAIKTRGRMRLAQQEAQ